MNEGRSIDAAAAPDDAVAVIVVHGVADQARGETAEAVSLQIALETGGAVARGDVPLHVPPCGPAVPYAAWDVRGLARLPQAIRKSFGHSLRSDFVDPRLGGADSEIVTREKPARALPNSAAARNEVPLDVRYTDFLLAKAAHGRAEQAADAGAAAPTVHAAARFDVTADPQSAGTPRVSVFEMYWADLSRLPGFAPRIVAELFTLLFDLVRIGGQTVGIHAAGSVDAPLALGTLARLHRIADQLYTRLLAMLMLQLVVCAVVAVTAAALAPHARGAATVAALLVAVIAAAFAARKARSWVVGLGAGVATFAALLIAVQALAQAQPSPLPGIVITLAVLLVALGYAAALLYWEQRFRAVLGYGLALGTLSALCIAWGVWRFDGLHVADGWMIGAMRGAELVLLLQMAVWCALAVACAAVVAWGWRAGRQAQGPGAAAVLHVIRTGRLGLFASLGAFVVFATAAWALVNKSLCSMLAPVHYPALLLHGPAAGSDGCSWFNARFAGSTETFSLVALMLSLVIGFVVVVLGPCMAAELRAWRYRGPAAIGEWLSRGYRALDRLLGWGSWLALAGMLIGALLLAESLATSLGGAPWEWLHRLTRGLGASSADLLHTLVIAVAGTTTGLIALGRVTARRFKALRAPLDAALDVDVHFREFPRAAIARVRIVERYAALLQHVLDLGFRRIVIVAHSQGTVITADLLRYLHRRDALVAAAAGEPGREQRTVVERGDADRLGRLAAALRRVDLDLLTLGCPLRQLYAQRFPALYGWACRPEPRDLGVRRWFNAWGSADYVGRWLWGGGANTPPLDEPAAAYAGPVIDQPDRHDVCIGAAAHTHYFESDQRVVRERIMALLQAPRAGAAAP